MPGSTFRGVVMTKAISSASAEARLRAALTFLSSASPSSPITIVAASRGAADDLARGLARLRGATFGVRRYGFNELVAKLAAVPLARQDRTVASPLSVEAIAARAAFELADDLEYFNPVAATPGFPRAVARTLTEVSQAGRGLCPSGRNRRGGV